MPQFVTATAEKTAPQFDIEPVDIDDYSAIRHVHALSIQRVLGTTLTTEETDALASHVRTAEYTAQLMAHETLVARVNDMVVGSISWSRSPDSAPVARISRHFVHPLYVGVGIGRALLDAAVEAAAQAGFAKTMARVPLMAMSLYETAGFTTMSQGVSKDLAPSVSLHVAFMRRG